MALIVNYYADLDMGGAGGDGSVGNPWRTIVEMDTGAAIILAATGVKAFVKSNTRGTEVSGLTTLGAASATKLNPYIIEGYTTTPGDGGSALIGVAVGGYLKFNNPDVTIKNLDVEGDYDWGAVFHSSGSGSAIYNVKAVNKSNYATNMPTVEIDNAICLHCNFESNGAEGSGAPAASCDRTSFYACVFKSKNIGLYMNSAYRNQSVVECIFIDTSSSLGSGKCGIEYTNKQLNSSSNLFTNNTFYGFEYSVLYAGEAPLTATGGDLWTKNIFAKASIAAIGSNSFSLSEVAVHFFDNAFWANALDTQLAFKELFNSIALSADPFTAVATEDFSLNNVTDGGALIKGIAQSRGGGSFITYRDYGAIQSQGSGGGSSSVVTVATLL